jgi:hypothetical protein
MLISILVYLLTFISNFRNFSFDYAAVAIATIVILLVLTGITLVTKYIIRRHRRGTVRSSAKVYIFSFLFSIMSFLLRH